MWRERLWDTDVVRRALQRASIEWIGTKLSVMAWRHISVAIFRRFIQDEKVQKTVSLEE